MKRISLDCLITVDRVFVPKWLRIYNQRVYLSILLSRIVSKIQPIRVAYAESRTANQKPGNLKFCATFEKTLIGRLKW